MAIPWENSRECRARSLKVKIEIDDLKRMNMKIAAGIIGLLSGIFGVIGGFIQTGAGVIIDESMAKNGANAFWLSWLVIILSSVIFAKPKIPGLLLIVIGIVCFQYGNVFSSPFTIVAGIIAIFSPMTKANGNYPKADSGFDIEKYRY